MRKGFATIAIIAAAVITAGCASSARVNSAPMVVPELLNIDASAWSQAQQPRPLSEILQVDQSMREFARARVNTRLSTQRRIDQLTNAVLQPSSLGLKYSDIDTRTAQEAFAAANGNCLSLSLLFVALAREVGIDARFYEVKLMPEWTLTGDVVFAARHVNVGGKINSRSTYVMDFSPYISQRKLSSEELTDQQALALYYNNIGAGLLADGDLPSAYLHFRKSLTLAPGIGYVWSNLAVVLSRNQQREEAEKLLRHAIALEPSNTSAVSNLYSMLFARGDIDEARSLRHRIDRAQQNNPYYQLALSEVAEAKDELGEALRLIDTAIELSPNEPLFYESAARIAQNLERGELSQQYAETASRLYERRKNKHRRSMLRF